VTDVFMGACELDEKARLLIAQILARVQVSCTEADTILHPETFSAQETQAVLPSRVVVQKTVTIDFSGTIILCTGIGESMHLTKEHLLFMGDSLHLTHKRVKNHTINPPSFDPRKELGMEPGMVSSFLFPGACSRLSAVFHLLSSEEMHHPEEQKVAISLSLRQSLLVSRASFRFLVKEYASQAYQYSLSFYEIPSTLRGVNSCTNLFIVPTRTRRFSLLSA